MTAEYDVFVSHASEDKEAFVKPLVAALNALGLKVWYDELTLRLGDKLTANIHRGLASSTHGVVVLSPAFFLKKWTEIELNSLVAKAVVEDRSVILPVWHNVTRDEVAEYSETLADIIAVSSREDVHKTAADILEVVRRGQRHHDVHAVLVSGKKEIEKLTAKVLEHDAGSVVQTHLLSNVVPVEVDLLIGAAQKPATLRTRSYSRVIGVSNRPELEFLRRSVSAAATSKGPQIDVRGLSTLQIADIVDRLPNFVASSDMCLITFPDRGKDNTFALFISGSKFNPAIKEWLDGFAKPIPHGDHIQPALERELTLAASPEVNEWLLKTIAWALRSEHGEELLCVSLVGSYCGVSGGLREANDIDIVIVLADHTAENVGAMKSRINQICRFFSSSRVEFVPDFREGPTYDYLKSTHPVQSIHVLFCTAGGTARWPAHIRRWRRAQHRDLVGSLNAHVPEATPDRQSVRGLDFGLEGMRKALSESNAIYRLWHGGKRTDHRYAIEGTERVLGFALYSVMKGGGLYLDAFGKPGFFDEWNGRSSDLDKAVEDALPTDLAECYRDARELANGIRERTVVLHEAMALDWKQRASVFIDTLLSITA